MPRSSLPIPLLLLAALALVGCREPAATGGGQPAATAPQPGGLPDRDSALAHRLVEQQGALLLDVRTKEEFDAGHIEGARHLPFDEVPARMDEIRGWVDGKTDHPVVVYCRTGRRSGIAKTSMVEAGFSQVTNLGGMNAW